MKEINIEKLNEPNFRTRRWEGRPPYEMSCWGRMLIHPRTKDPTVVVPGIPGLRAVPDLVTIHPILPPTVHYTALPRLAS